jgi:hypothetical protein
MYDEVFVETQSGSFKKRRITVNIKDDYKSYINPGLKNGDKLVSEAAFLLDATLPMQVMLTPNVALPFSTSVQAISCAAGWRLNGYNQ